MGQHHETKALIEAIVANIRAGRLVDKPFHHIVFDRVFPDDIYAEIVAGMPTSAGYRSLPGRHNENIRDDGAATRVKLLLLALEGFSRLTSDLFAGFRPVARPSISAQIDRPGVRVALLAGSVRRRIVCKLDFSGARPQCRHRSFGNISPRLRCVP